MAPPTGTGRCRHCAHGALLWAALGVACSQGGAGAPAATDAGDSGGGLAVGEGMAESADGVSIWYRAVGGGAADTHDVILMHGGPGIGSTYLAPFEALARPNLRIVRLNQRGVPPSTHPENQDYGMARILEDIDAVASAVGIDRFTFAGNSWGGLVGMRYATRSPERLESMLFLSSMTPAASLNPQFDQVRKQRIADLQARGFIPASLPDSITDLCGWVAAILPVYFADPAFVPPPELANNVCDQEAARLSWDQNSSPPYDLRDELATLALPVLSLGGTGDWLAGAARLVADAFEPDAPVVMIPDAGHFTWIEKPAATLPVVAEFLDAPGSASR